MSMKLETRYTQGFVRAHEMTALQPQVSAAHRQLHDRSGLGNDFLGWLTLPSDYDREEFARIQAAAARIQADTDVFIAIGIGGSYLGARAAIEFLKSPLYNNKKKDTPDIYFPATASAPPPWKNCSSFAKANGYRSTSSPNRAPPPNRQWLSGCGGIIWSARWARKKPAGGSM